MEKSRDASRAELSKLSQVKRDDIEQENRLETAVWDSNSCLKTLEAGNAGARRITAASGAKVVFVEEDLAAVKVKLRETR